MAHAYIPLRNRIGRSVPQATVSVFDAGTQDLAPLFSDVGLQFSINNPLVADLNGVVDFYIASGTYDLLVQRFDIKDTLIENVDIVAIDPPAATPLAGSFATSGGASVAIFDDQPVVVFPANGATSVAMVPIRLPSEMIGADMTIKTYWDIFTGSEQVRLSWDITPLGVASNYTDLTENLVAPLTILTLTTDERITLATENSVVFRLRRLAGDVSDDNTEDVHLLITKIEITAP